MSTVCHSPESFPTSIWILDKDSDVEQMGKWPRNVEQPLGRGAWFLMTLLVAGEFPIRTLHTPLAAPGTWARPTMDP